MAFLVFQLHMFRNKEQNDMTSALVVKDQEVGVQVTWLGYDKLLSWANGVSVIMLLLKIRLSNFYLEYISLIFITVECDM